MSNLSNTQLEDIFHVVDRMEREISGLKTSLCVIEAQLRLHVLQDQQKEHASQIERLSTGVEDLKKELEVLDWQVTEIKDEASLEFQHVRAHDVLLQQLIEASPAHSHIDLYFEIENYDPERHRRETRQDQWDGLDVNGYPVESHSNGAVPGNPPTTTVTSDPEN